NWYFVKTDFVAEFFVKAGRLLPVDFVLFTHNSDYPIDDRLRAIADHPRLIAWFAMNLAMDHPKVHPIPIGIANAGYLSGEPATFQRIAGEPIAREALFYANYSLGTN